MSMEDKSTGSTAELTKAERAARGSVPESAESVVPDPSETKQAATIVRTTSIPPFLVIAGGSEAPSMDSFETPGDELDDATASSLIEVRKELS